jgi:hypothetical protein
VAQRPRERVVGDLLPAVDGRQQVRPVELLDLLADVRRATLDAGGDWDVYAETPYAPPGTVTAAGIDATAPSP